MPRCKLDSNNHKEINMEAIIITAILFAAFVGGIYLVTRDRPEGTGSGSGVGGGGGRDPDIDENVK